MTPLTENGFLGKEITAVISEIRTAHLDLFNLCSEVNKLCHKTLYDIDAHSEEPQELLVATLYLRIKSSFQAVVILSERGMIPQAKVVLRSILEALFTICALSKKAELCEKYMLAHQIKRLKQITKFKMLKNGSPQEAKEEKILKLEQELKKDIEERKIRKLSVEDWSKEAELHDIYLSAYTVLCDPVHTNVKELERYIYLDENDAIKGFDWGPDTRDLDTVLSSNIEFMLVSLKATCDLFDIDKEKEVTDLNDKLKELVDRQRELEK